MYAEFTYDYVPGPLDEGAVLLQVMLEFDFKPNRQERKRSILLTDAFICEIQNSLDFENVRTRPEPQQARGAAHHPRQPVQLHAVAATEGRSDSHRRQP